MSTDQNGPDEGLPPALADLRAAHDHTLREAEQLGDSGQKAWVPYEGPEGGTGWRNPETDEVVYSDEPPGETISEEDIREELERRRQAGELNEQVGQVMEEVGLDEVVPPDQPAESVGSETFEPGAGLAAGATAVLDEDRSDFHDVRNDILRADSRGEAMDALADHLSPSAAEEALERAEEIERLADEYVETDDPASLEVGQHILAVDGRGMPKTGVVDSVEADGTAWMVMDERDHTSGVKPASDNFTVFADPDGGIDGTSQFVGEPGRYGIASDPEVLEKPYEAADEITPAREAGIQEGNTTAEEMDILEMPDGSRVFSIPADAYSAGSFGGISISPDEAKRRNLESPAVVEAFGGNAAKTNVVEAAGRERIVKEGVDGEMLQETPAHRRPDWVRESLQETYAAGYFAGNSDLHGGNVVVDEDGQAVIIDHDAQTDKTDAPPRQARRLGIVTDEVVEEIADRAREFAEGGIELPEETGPKTREVVINQVEKAARQFREAAFGDFESAPGDVPDDFEDLAAGQPVTIMAGGRVKEGTIESAGPLDVVVETDDGETHTAPEAMVLETNTDGGET